jgi:hypothetical protein
LINYFATSLDILECESLVEAGKADLVGHGRAHDYRLAFEATSSADRPTLAKADHMVAWGAAYRVPTDALDLDRRKREEIEVTPWKGDSLSCVAAVRSTSFEEGPPQPEAMARLHAYVASTEEFPQGFVKFISDLASGEMAFGRGSLMVTGHRGSGRAPLHGILRLHPIDAEKLGITGPTATVVYGRSTCPVSTEQTKDCPQGICQLNQSVRAALGMEGRHSFGQRVALYPLDGSLDPPALIHPRPLALRLYRPARTDSEKNIVVLHEKNMQLIGVTPGDFVRLRVASKRKGASNYRLKSHSLRAYPGLEKEVRRGNDLIPYPRVAEVYVDAYGRGDLGLGQEDQEVVVLVTANVWRLFLSRIVFYGSTLLLALIASQALVDAFGSLLAPVFGVAITLGVTVFDLRSRIQY